MDLKILEKIGLTEGEVKVYLALLDIGESATGKIIEKSRITSSKVYLILERLERKGLVSHVVRNNVKKFKASNPARLIDYLKEKEYELKKDVDEAEKLIPFLQGKIDRALDVRETTMFQGPRGFQTARDEFISDLKVGGEYCVFGAQNPFKEIYKNTIKNFAEDNERKGIKTRLIYTAKNAEIVKIFKPYKLTKVRVITSPIPSSVAISKTKVLLMAYGENPIQVLVQSKELAESFLQFFDSVWKISK